MKTTETEMNAADEVKNDQVITTNKGENMTDKLTTKCVKAINKQAMIEKGAWIEQGRLVMEYVAAFKGTDDAALKKLADHPDCIHGFQQLRNYWKAYEVYSGIKTKTGINDLPMTHYVAVQSKNLTPYKREALLKQAKKRKWSVADLKVAIKGNDSADKKKGSFKIVSRLERLYDQMSKFSIDGVEGILPEATNNEVVDALKRIWLLAIQKGLISKEDTQATQATEPSEETEETDDTDDLFEDAA